MVSCAMQGLGKTLPFSQFLRLADGKHEMLSKAGICFEPIDKKSSSIDDDACSTGKFLRRK